MTSLQTLLTTYVDAGTIPGAVALVARGDRVEVATAGFSDTGGTSPMARDSVFRIASITKPITAAAVMMLVDEGRIALDEPVRHRLPELAAPSVVRTPQGPVDDVVPAVRAITVRDLLTFRAGYGFPSDFSLPAVGLLFSELRQGPPQPDPVPAPDEWMAALSRIPLLHQPGDAWLYNTCSDILGVLVARASGRSFPDFLAERLFGPLGMTDTGFAVPAAERHRLAHFYQPTQDGLEPVPAPGGDEWGSLPAFPSGAGGLVSTADDWHAFGRMLLAEGAANGRRLLSPESVRLMTTDHLTPGQRAAGSLFLEGQGWGFGGSVDVTEADPWNVPGRYGWVGGTGTSAHIDPSTGMVAVLLSQVAMTGPAPTPLMRDFWRYAAGA
ncbi:beta-lactamase family protein [Streptomyces sp. SID10853]|uniref:serine hydrolase domain-containing protein n=1 Tax=Streptomyces sp. SID10853 TaxID=2706028 RepID=UPI0013C0160C|nr:serine hydrolase domain-containing protein [Streptomyces sp. SID10853]NDZ79977.1 beta-lactamase family protein [Streptomyces sp. SID10853]